MLQKVDKEISSNRLNSQDNVSSTRSSLYVFQIILRCIPFLFITAFLCDGFNGTHYQSLHPILQAKTEEYNVSISHKELTLYIKDKSKLILYNLPAKSKVQWRSSNEAVALISTRGNITAKGQGKTIINAVITLPNHKTITLTTALKVNIPPVKEIKLPQENIILITGKTKQLNPKVLPAYADNKSLYYKIDNGKIASITKTGRLTALTPGNTLLTVTSENGTKAHCKVTVTEKKIPPLIKKLTFTCDGDFIIGAAKGLITVQLDKTSNDTSLYLLNQEDAVVHSIDIDMSKKVTADYLWDGRNSKGNKVSSGWYRVSLYADGRRKTTSKLYIQSASEFKGGNGSANQPYLIQSASDLDRVREYNGRFFLQTQDINLTKLNFMPLFSSKKKFTGYYDGGGYSVNHLTIEQKGESNIALFAGIAKEGTVKNIKIKNCFIVGGDYTAGIAGNNKGNIINCSVSGFIHGERYVAGVCGYNTGNVKKCSAVAIVTGKKTGSITIDIYPFWE